MGDHVHNVTGVWHDAFGILLGDEIMSGGQKEETWDDVINAFLDEKFISDFWKYLSATAKSHEEAAELVEQKKALDEPPNRDWYLNLNIQCEEISARRQELDSKFSPRQWITENYEKAHYVIFATHVPKLTHSMIDSSAFYDRSKTTKGGYLSTSSLKDKSIDGVVNNAFAPIHQFLTLKLNGQELKDEFLDSETNVLKSFAANDQEMQTWNRGFSASLTLEKPSSHSLIKQVYFPVSPNKYHLLNNVVSSSKAHALFQYVRNRIHDKEAVKLRDKGKFSDTTYFQFPNRAEISVTASNHGNASQLNGTRGGRLTLFSCQPPVWQSSPRLPIYKTSFYYMLGRNVEQTVEYLCDFLLRFEQLELSIKDPERFKWLERWIEDVSDEIITSVKSVQALPPGWSNVSGIKLKESHRILLDCYREDEEFNLMRQRNNWQEVIVQDFADWLNNQLHRKNNKFTPQRAHTSLWKKLFEANVREVLGL